MMPNRTSTRRAANAKHAIAMIEPNNCAQQHHLVLVHENSLEGPDFSHRRIRETVNAR